MTEFSTPPDLGLRLSSLPSVAVADEGGSRRWRSLWRLHFYSGMFAIPFIVLMACTGLVILYTQPLRSLTEGHLRNVAVEQTARSLDDQTSSVEKAFPKAIVTSLTVGVKPSNSTIFSIDDGSKSGRQVFVDPYSAKVLGSNKADGGVVGLANRLHGFLNINSLKVPLPTVSALWDGGAVMRPYIVFDLLLEVLGVWTLVLVLSGLYLWWPRRSKTVGGGATTDQRTPSKRGLFRVRFNAGGRARWRDLHGMSGVLLLSAMLVTVVSGLAWSTYWGPNFSALANKITPNTWTDAPPSAVGKRGDLDRFGNQIPWNTADAPIPASYRLTKLKTVPAPLGLDAVNRVAASEKMKPGYQISFPKNVVDKATGQTAYGSFTLSNSWPRKTGEANSVYVDQFTGKTLGATNAYGYGAVSYGLDALVSTHMGTQLGIFSRIMMTSLCVLSLWSITSALVMYTKRRRPGTAGLPRRPVDVKFAKRMTVSTWVMAVMFPAWGLTAAFVLGIDRFVIRRNRRMRVAFGQRA